MIQFFVKKVKFITIKPSGKGEQMKTLVFNKNSTATIRSELKQAGCIPIDDPERGPTGQLGFWVFHRKQDHWTAEASYEKGLTKKIVLEFCATWGDHCKIVCATHRQNAEPKVLVIDLLSQEALNALIFLIKAFDKPYFMAE